MAELRNKRLSYFIALLAIVVVYSFYYLFFIYDYFKEIPLQLRHVLKFLSILIVYGIGSYGLKKNVSGWLVQIWHIIYLGILLLLLLIGIYDWVSGKIPFQIRNIANNLQEFVISPILYVAMGIINNRLSK